nr:tail fiber domain-containing protein [Stenotrophomonas geniculata]
MPKYADPSVYPVGTPASTDNVMTRTAAGADGNFALGNLAGIAGAAVATDQSVYLGSGGWASYSLTAAGRSLSGVAGTANTFPYFSAANVVTLGAVGATGLSSLAAANQVAGRTAIGAADASNVVDLTSNQNVGGLKTFTTVSIWNLGTSAGSIEYSTPGGFPGIAFKVGDYTGSAFARSDFRSGSGLLRLGPGTTTAAPTVFLDVVSGTGLRCSSSNVWALGGAANLWTTVYATNSTINTSDARLKTEPRHLKDAEFKAASAIARLPAVWRWLSRVHGDENCDPEGMAARKHFGPTVQAAMAVMEAHGLDPFAYSFICYDEWEAEPATYDEEGNELTPAREAGDRYSFRKEELLCGMVSALAREIDDVKAENAELRGQLTELAARLAALEAKA